MNTNTNWQCPYCGHYQVLSKGNNLQICDEISSCVKTSEHKDIGFRVISISCLNKQCKKLSMTISLSEVERSDFPISSILKSNPIKVWKLLPDSIAKPQPDYIPKFIRKDYEEACKIACLSPNASAVLARRCLESMIKDFCEIKENSLYLSIETLKIRLEKNQAPKGVTEETIEAISSIRRMGRIGAHMKEKIGMLVDIDPKEASLLVELIEMLFKEWYVVRNERQERLKSIQKLIAKKEKQNTTEEKKQI